jgi:hypothetical protein
VVAHARSRRARQRAASGERSRWTPNFAAAAAILGFQYMTDYVNRWTSDPDRSLRQARGAGRVGAAALDPAEPQAHFALGATAIWLRRP